MNKWLKTLNVILLSFSLLISFSFPAAAQGVGYSKMSQEFNLGQGEGGQKIPVGSTILHTNDNITKVFDQNNSLILMVRDSDADWVSTPQGVKRTSHTYNVPSGTEINHVGNVVKCSKDGQLILTVIDNKPEKSGKSKQNPPGNSHWVETANITTTPTYVSAWWQVPYSPSANRSTTTVYLFPSIMSSTYIIQPVLAFNVAYDDGPLTRRWTGASWYVWGNTMDDSFHSTPINVEVGDDIFGSMNCTTTPNRWTIRFFDQDANQATDLIVYTSISIYNSNRVDFALEAYNGTADGPVHNDDMPGFATFTSINVSANGQDLKKEWIKSYFTTDQTLDITWEQTYITLGSGNTTVNLITPT